MSEIEEIRLIELSKYAKGRFDNSIDHAASLEAVIAKCAETATSAKILTSDLTALFIGDNFTSGRGKGAYFIGNFNGALHFKSSIRDQYNQVQHAIAGVLLAYKGFFYINYAYYRENEEQDKLLYRLMTPIGRSLDDSNYRTLSTRIYLALADFDSMRARIDLRRNIA